MLNNCHLPITRLKETKDNYEFICYAEELSKKDNRSPEYLLLQIALGPIGNHMTFYHDFLFCIQDECRQIFLLHQKSI